MRWFEGAWRTRGISSKKAPERFECVSACQALFEGPQPHSPLQPRDRRAGFCLRARRPRLSHDELPETRIASSSSREALSIESSLGTQEGSQLSGLLDHRAGPHCEEALLRRRRPRRTRSRSKSQRRGQGRVRSHAPACAGAEATPHGRERSADFLGTVEQCTRWRLAPQWLARKTRSATAHGSSLGRD